MKENKLNQFIESFELIFIAHTPQDGTGIILCKARNATLLYEILCVWRDSFNILFNIKPALTSEELLAINPSKDF